MNWKALFRRAAAKRELKARIAELERDLALVEETRDGWERMYWKQRAIGRELRAAIVDMTAEIADLNKRLQPRDPKTGRMMTKGARDWIEALEAEVDDGRDEIARLRHIGEIAKAVMAEKPIGHPYTLDNAVRACELIDDLRMTLMEIKA